MMSRCVILDTALVTSEEMDLCLHLSVNAYICPYLYASPPVQLFQKIFFIHNFFLLSLNYFSLNFVLFLNIIPLLFIHTIHINNEPIKLFFSSLPHKRTTGKTSKWFVEVQEIVANTQFRQCNK